MASSASVQVQFTIKDLLKRGGYQQKDLAAALGVSVPTVKRLLNGREIGLERLVGIAHFFNLSVFELMDLCRQKKTDAFPFTSAQEALLAKSLLHLVVFRGFLRGHDALWIKARYGLSSTQLERCLVGLDKVGLIEFWSEERVRLKAKWPFKWLDGGVLQRTYMPALLKKIFAYSLESSGQGAKPGATRNYFLPYELALKSATYADFRKELETLLEKYRSISKFELISTEPDHLIDVTGLVSCVPFVAWDELLRDERR